MRNTTLISVLLLLLFSCTACVMPATNEPAYQVQPNLVSITETNTPQPTKTRLPSATLLASKTVPATLSPTASVGNTPTPFVVAELPISNADKMIVIQDVSYPDGSVLKPAALFIKTWRVENSGSTTWNSQYLIAHAQEISYSGPKVTQLYAYPPDTELGWNIGSWPEPLNEVNPGDIVDISIVLQTPNQHGYQIGIWNLLNTQGQRFANPLWAQLQIDGSIAADQLGWNGSWIVNDPYLNDPQFPVVFAFETSDQWTHGYFYNTFGQLNIISGRTGSDQLILDGLYGKPNQRVGGTPLLLHLNQNGQSFTGTFWHENQAQSPLCGARDEETYIEYCLPKEIDPNEPSPTQE
jgi:hypothetical protein